MESSQREIDRAQTFDRPIPGQSLTNSPDQKYPWETPPQFTNVTEAQLYLFAELTQKDRFVALTNALADKVPVDINFLLEIALLFDVKVPELVISPVTVTA